MIFDLDTALKAITDRYTPEQRAKDETVRVGRIAALKPRLDPNSYDQRVARARQQITAVLEQIEMIQGHPDSELRTQRGMQAAMRFAELVAETGDYESAAAIAPDPKQSQWFGELAEAIARPDGAVCECSAPNTSVIAEIPSVKHGRLMKVERCSQCKFLNAR